MPLLSVNVDHVATLRQARRAAVPDPVQAALLAELGGAGGITVHLRADRRHIQERDVRVLKAVCRTRLDVELAATPANVRFAVDLRPDLVTLVPERAEEITTEGGLDLSLDPDSVRKTISDLKEAGIEVSLFLDPETESVKAAHRIAADAVELNTGRYAAARERRSADAELEKLAAAARLLGKLGVRVFAGHGLDYRNVRAVARIPEIAELNIGHAIVAHAQLVGMERAVREMLAAF